MVVAFGAGRLAGGLVVYGDALRIVEVTPQGLGIVAPLAG